MQIDPYRLAIGMSSSYKAKNPIPTKVEASPGGLELGVEGPTNGFTQALDSSFPEMDSFPQHRTISTGSASYVNGPTRGFSEFLSRSYPERDYKRD